MRTFTIVFAMLLTANSFGQKKQKFSREEYIVAYKELAMREMKRTGIPASITLAQGLLESSNGNSTLAVKANNHFGIKCHDWQGPSVRHDDDKKNECFRKYRNVEKSYQDHSDFLTSRSRYASLFELKPDDYKAWARGLKKAGYATSPTYASALIKIIEDNELYRYDEEVLATNKTKGKGKFSVSAYHGNRKILYNNRVKYIEADSGDTYESISEELYMFSWQLPKYNEQPANKKLQKGEMVYLQPKRRQAAAGNKTHLVAEGETMHSISQKYGVREEKLRKRNKIDDNAEPEPGTQLLLRGHRKEAALPVKTFTPEKSKEKEHENKNRNREEEKPEFEIEFDLGS